MQFAGLTNPSTYDKVVFMTKKEILNIALRLVKDTNRYPTMADLATEGVTRAKLRTHYTSLEELKDDLVVKSKDILDPIRTDVKRSIKPGVKRLIVTTAVAGAKADQGFLKSLDVYAKARSAEVVILVSVTDAHTVTIDPSLKKYTIITTDTALNSKIGVLGIKNSAKKADPVTGLPRIGQRNGSFIGASPKQRLKFVATGPSTLPHALMTTGAVTLPNYTQSRDLITQLNYVSEQDHVMGAVVVELEDDTFFHFRQVQADSKGRFADLGKLYSPSGVKDYAPEAFVLGDWHSGETDPEAYACWEAVSKATKVKSWIMHDMFSGNSINPHVRGKHLTRAKMAAENLLSLKDELDGFVKDVLSLSNRRKLVIVKSNHDEFLDRYLNDGMYLDDAPNHRLALDLACAVLDNKNPLQDYFENNAKKTKNPVKWLVRDESYKVADVELGQHGDIGSNGARGSAVSMESAYGKCVYGHSHTPNILRESWCVGTSTYLQLSYNRGASSWFHSSCLVYPNGQRQMINNIQGRYTI